MLHAGNSASAVGRGLPTSQDTTNSYKVVLPRLPTRNVVLNTVFLHADLKGHPYRAPDFRDALAQILDLREILCIGQYQMSHVWMVTCESSSSKQKLVNKAEFPVKGLRCMVFDPDTKNVKVKLLWLPRYMEHRRIVEALEPYGTVQSVEREKWRCPGMEHMETANRELSLTLKDGVSASTIPHTLNVYGVQALVLIPGRPPLCPRCSRVGHVRRQCRTPRCTQCRRFGHTAEYCVLSYADRLCQGQWSREDDVASEHIMDVSEVVDATGELSHEHRIDEEQKTSTPQNNTEYEAREGTLWRFLKEVADTFNFLTVRFSLDYLYSLSRKQMTQALTESLFPTPLYRQHYLGSLEISVLKRVRRMCIQAAAKTFFFKLHTATLPVTTFLNDKGMFVPWNVNCRLCNVPETIDHCFILCRDAMSFWDILQRTLKKDIEITPHTIRFLPVDKNSVVPYDVFVLMGLFSLWKSRMMDRHAEPPRSSKSVFREQCALVRSGPLCLRCRGKGHDRRECKIPRCGACRRFGHEESECARTYARATGRSSNEGASELKIDELDAEEAATGKGGNVLETLVPLSTSVAEGSGRLQPASSVPQDGLPDEKAAVFEDAAARPNETSENAESQQEEMVVTVAASSSQAGKRPREKNSDALHTPEEGAKEPPAKAPGVRRPSFKPRPNVPLDPRQAAKPPP
ncbi:uncharacterized protein LOC144123970 [Amblyomma americanum]